VSKGAIGTTIVSGSLASDIDNFWFAVKEGAAVKPFDFVSVKNPEGRIIGIVDDLKVIPEGGSNSVTSYSEKGILVAKVAILAHESFLSDMPVLPGKKVSLANSKEAVFALGIPKMANPIPAGIIQMTGGLQVPVSLDISYLAGPDTAHVNASGISGNRKTTYLLFLLQSAYQRLSRQGAGLIIFNTKEQDLLQIDIKEDWKKFGRQDREFFDLLDLDTRPFSNVTYYLPRGSDGRPNSAVVPKNSMTYSYELADIYDRLELLFSHTSDAHYDSILSIVNYIAESWPVKDGTGNVSTWSDLARFKGYPEEIVAHRSMLAHFAGHLQKFRKSTLFVDKRKTSIYLGEEMIARIRSGHVCVIDIAKLPTLEEQALVVGDIMRAVDEMHSARSKGASGAKYVLVFIDEINRFLPRPVPGTMMPATAEQIMRTVIAGKSRSTVLFSAQQFKSTVNSALHENTGAHTFAKLGMTELLMPEYSMIDESVKRSIVRLNKGEIVMTHPAFRHPIKIVFPRPSFRRP
jgi:DNA helicase HerA-like ATPase